MTSFRGIEELSALGSKAQKQVALPSKVVNVVSVGGEPLSLWETFLLYGAVCSAVLELSGCCYTMYIATHF